MKYLLIKGVYLAVGYSPDGDTIRFQAHNPDLWNQIQTENRERFEEKLQEDSESVTLRLQGIDALETHYSPGIKRVPRHLKESSEQKFHRPMPGNHKQPRDLGDFAGEELLRLLGITDVKWRRWGKNSWIDHAVIESSGQPVRIEDKNKDRVPGYIITNDVERNGRPIAWLFAGNPPLPDGSVVSKEQLAEMGGESLNYKLLRGGSVYPYFFMTLPAVLRNKLVEAAKLAERDATAGRHDDHPSVWTLDRCSEGITIDTLQAVTQEYALLPYFFRKIIQHWYHCRVAQYCDYLEGHGDPPPGFDPNISLDGFFDQTNPYLFVVSEQDFVRLDHVMQIEGNRLTMMQQPYDLVFLS